MATDILVSIVSGDLFCRNWMSLLLVRDWRTRLASEIDLETQVVHIFGSPTQRVDCLLVDVDDFFESAAGSAIIKDMLHKYPELRVMFVGTEIESRLFERYEPSRIAGYLKKDEIGTSLGWAITFAYENHTIFTPEAFETASRLGFEIPQNKLIMQRRTLPGLTGHQGEIARLAIIFSLGRRDLADELKISDQWSYGIVSELYTRLGLDALFDGSYDPFQYLQDDPIIQVHLQEIISELGNNKKARDLETLAFHLITMPVIEE